MLGTRRCLAKLADGRPCRASPMRDQAYCLFHSPDHSAEVAEARKLGGIRRRREQTLSVAYDFEGLGSTESIGRIIEIATLDALGLENSIARCRVLIAAATAASRLLEVGELEARLAVLEAAAGRGQAESQDAAFPAEAPR
jgi:uncharacterized small protein (DUF1192 family)